MRVAYVTMLFPVPSETFASNDVRELASRGVEMTVHSLRPAAPHTTELVGQRGLATVACTYHTGLRSVARGSWLAVRRPGVAFDLLWALLRFCAGSPEQFVKSVILLPRVLEIFEHLSRQRPDVVHAFWSSFPTMVVYLVQRHLPEMVTSISFGAHDIVMRYGLGGPVARRADFVRTLAHVNVRQVEEGFAVPADRIEVVYNGVDLSLLPPPTERVPFRIVTAGRLVERKGMEQVLRVFARLREQWPDASLRVLGAGPLLPKLRRLSVELGVSSAVSFPGHVAQRDVLGEMRRAEVFLFLSETDYDRLPNVVKEAMVCGCLCVAGDTDGIEELIAHGTTGFIVASDELEGTVRLVDDVFAGRIDAVAMTRAAEAAIRQRFDFNNSVQLYQERWSELVRQRRGVGQARSSLAEG